jgi:hypothetical protein
VVGKIPDGRPVAADNRAILRSLANLFQRYPNTYLLLMGFTAGKGDDNEEDRRVYTVVTFLSPSQLPLLMLMLL